MGRPVILLRKDALRERLDKHAGPGFQAQGEFLGLSRWTMMRLLRDEITPGETVIASALAALAIADGRKPGGPLGDLFDELFEVSGIGVDEAA